MIERNGCLPSGALTQAHIGPSSSPAACVTEATAIFVMAPSYLHRVVWEYGEDLADKAYLFADPFTKPVSLGKGEYTVADPSFDNRPTRELLRECQWMRERVLQIRLALLGDGRPLVPLSEYVELCKTVDRGSH